MANSVLRRLGIVVGCGLLATASLLVVQPVADAAEPAPPMPYTITTEPADLSKVQDGDQVKITISGLPANASATVAMCPDPMRNNLTSTSPISRFSAYCKTVYSESVPTLFSGTVRALRNAATQKIVVNYTVVRGGIGNAVNVPEKTGPYSYSYRCDEQNPCALWIQFGARQPGATSNTIWLDDSLKISPQPADGLPVGCADPDPAASFTLSLPERLGKSNQRWNEILCSPTGAPPPAASLRTNEGEALAGFDAGERDMAFTGSGSALSQDTTRQRTYVPAALNAVVVAAVGRQQIGTSDGGGIIQGPIADNLKFEWSELATFLSQRFANTNGGVFADGAPAVVRNPVLSTMSTFYRLTEIGAMVGPDSLPFLLSSALTQKVPGQWKFPENESDGGGKPVGVLTDFLDLSPGSIPNVTRPASNKVGLLSAMREIALGTPCASTTTAACVGYVVTDLATATEYGWTPIAVPNSSGQFVAPTAASLAAGASHMVEAEDGTLRPGDTGTDANAYPLTFVEYAAAPVNPLVGEDCQPQETRQNSLNTFLSMLPSGGQQVLGPGLTPLTPELAQEAKERAATVGTGTVEAACEEQQENSNTGSTPLDTTGTGIGGTGSGPVTESPTTAGAENAQQANAPSQTKTPTAATVQEAKKLADSVRIPPFLGSGLLGALIPLLALVVLVFLPSAMAYLAAGRPVPPWLTGGLRRLGDALSRLGRRVRGNRFVPARGDA